jgi:hypothetical protein
VICHCWFSPVPSNKSTTDPSSVVDSHLFGVGSPLVSMVTTSLLTRLMVHCWLPPAALQRSTSSPAVLVERYTLVFERLASDTRINTVLSNQQAGRAAFAIGGAIRRRKRARKRMGPCTRRDWRSHGVNTYLCFKPFHITKTKTMVDATNTSAMLAKYSIAPNKPVET